MSGQYSAPRYYEIAFDMNRRQEVNFLVHCFRRYARRKVLTVLDIACGTGPHLIRLAGRGYTMSGLDLSPENIAFLKERTAARGFDASLIVADMTRFKLRHPVDAAICGTAARSWLPSTPGKLTNSVFGSRSVGWPCSTRPGTR